MKRGTALLLLVAIVALAPKLVFAQDPDDDDDDDGGGGEIELLPPDEDDPDDADVIELLPPDGDAGDDEDAPIVILTDDEDDDSGDRGDEDDDDAAVERLRTIYITHTPEDLAVAGGSAHAMSEEDLEAQEYDDPHAILRQIPAVYARGEDGYGLRPNIGLRGATSERSKGVTLMEDGVLLGPAPYSAPAAYYFPLMTRMTGVEVYKGPGSILFGPNTIGGAINLLTRDLPADGHAAGLDLAAGTNYYGKAHAHYGWANEYGGVLVEGLHVRAGGFKDTDFVRDDTGFQRSDVMVKGRLNTDPNEELFHRVDIKLGFGHEHSNETYLGLTDDDFDADPYRRYLGSALDEMDWTRYQVQLGYRFEVGDTFDLTTVLYRHDFHRIWDKLNGFVGADIADVLENPDSGARRVFYDVLTGAADTSTDDELLRIGPNERTFVSQGIQIAAHHEYDGGELWGNEVRAGIRLHHDSIERDHAERLYRVTQRRLVRAGDGTIQTTINEASALALAVWLLDELRLWRFHIAPGVRVEHIRSTFEDQLAGTGERDRQDTVVVPGVGLHFAITDELGALAGVHRGFSPVAPGQPDGIDAETSINYEAGLRYVDPKRAAHFEAIGFFNDYSNLVGECSFSAGCGVDQLDRQFNAGNVFVWGAEALARYRVILSDGRFELPLRLAYTYTGSAFQSDFSSDNPQFGDVEQGDELPYVPEHQIGAGVGLESPGLFATHLGLTWVAPMREEAGQDDDERFTDHQVMLDLLASWQALEWASVYVKVDNILDTAPVISRRPFGARPPRPLSAMVGTKLEF